MSDSIVKRLAAIEEALNPGEPVLLPFPIDSNGAPIEPDADAPPSPFAPLRFCGGKEISESDF